MTLPLFDTLTRARLDAETPQVFRMSRELWVMAHLLGAARNGTHEVVRLHADRGAARNRQVHVLGAAADLVMLRVMLHLDRGSHSTEWYADSLLVERRQVSSFAPGVELPDGPLEVKAANLAFGDPWLKVNESKHQRLRAREPRYVFVCLQMNAKVAVVSRHIPWVDVEAWETRSFGQHHSSALYRPIREVADGDILPRDTVERVRAATWSMAELEKVREQAEANLATFVPGWRRLGMATVAAG